MSNQWFCQIADQEIGPISSSELKALAAEGKLGPDDLVRKDGQEGWATASQVKRLTFTTASNSPVMASDSATTPVEATGPPRLPPERPPAMPQSDRPAQTLEALTKTGPRDNGAADEIKRVARAWLGHVGPVVKRVLQEARNVAVATWEQGVRIIRYGVARWELRRAGRGAEEARFAHGKKLYEAGTGDSELIRQIAELTQQIDDKEAPGEVREKLKRRRAELTVQLSKAADSLPTAATEHSDVTASVADHEQRMAVCESTKAALWPRSSNERRRVIAGALGGAAVMLIVALWSISRPENSTDDVSVKSNSVIVELLDDAAELVIAHPDHATNGVLSLLANTSALRVALDPDVTPRSLSTLQRLAHNKDKWLLVTMQASHSLERVATKLSKAGEIDAALRTARQIPRDVDRAIILARIAEQAGRQGKRELATSLFKEASRLAQSAVADNAKLYVAVYAVRTGMPKFAESFVGSLPRQFQEDVKTERILADLRESGTDPYPPSAIQLKYAANSDRVRFQAIVNLCANGQPEKADQLAGEIETPLKKAEATALVGYSYRVKDDVNMALLTFFRAKLLAREITDGFLRAEHLVTIGELENRAGNSDVSMQTFHLALEKAAHGEQHYRQWACLVLSRLAIVQADRGWRSSSNDTVNEAQRLLRTSSSDYTACRAVAAATLRVRGMDEARAWLASDSNNLSRAAKMLGFAELLSRDRPGKFSEWSISADEIFAGVDLTQLRDEVMVLPFEWTSIRKIVDAIGRSVFRTRPQSGSIRGDRSCGFVEFLVMENGNGIAVSFRSSENGRLAYESFCHSPLFTSDEGEKILLNTKRFATGERPRFSDSGRFTLSYSIRGNEKTLVTIRPD